MDVSERGLRADALFEDEGKLNVLPEQVHLSRRHDLDVRFYAKALLSVLEVGAVAVHLYLPVSIVSLLRYGPGRSQYY
jgi:hypothetical protein